MDHWAIYPHLPIHSGKEERDTDGSIYGSTIHTGIGRMVFTELGRRDLDHDHGIIIFCSSCSVHEAEQLFRCSYLSIPFIKTSFSLACCFARHVDMHDFHEVRRRHSCCRNDSRSIAEGISIRMPPGSDRGQLVEPCVLLLAFAQRTAHRHNV